ncbi:ISNCY family transposase, partial [bacterium]|nr:ISNCY family transposase [bacterium]
HNYGHGEKNLCFNFFLLTLLAFYFHQIFELTDRLYQECRKKFGSKRHMWETLRSYIKILIFEDWEELLNFALDPTKYKICFHSP